MVPKSSEIFNCIFCNYSTCRKSQYDRHILTRKHKMLTNNKNVDQKSSTTTFICDCGKTYKHRQSLSLHKKKCIIIDFSNNNMKNININETNRKNNVNITEISDFELNNNTNYLSEDIKNLLIQQQKQIAEQQKQIGELIPKVGNTFNNTANIKQKLNVQIFLNEKCKDAINMNDFIQQIQLNLENLDFAINKGLSESLTSILIENMNKLSLYERPLHCTDSKRDTLYIKDNNSWEKDDNNTKIKEALKSLNNTHFKLIKQWMTENPDFKDVEQKQDYFANLLKTCGTNIDGVSEKVIKKICIHTNVHDDLKDLDENISD